MNAPHNAPDKIQVSSVAWLKPGWLYASRTDGFYVTRIDEPRGNIERFCRTVGFSIEDFSRKADIHGIFLAAEDCALITEHFPDVLTRS
jgi:hypothetical protein